MTRFAMLGGMPVPLSPGCEYFYTLSATGQGSPINKQRALSRREPVGGIVCNCVADEA